MSTEDAHFRLRLPPEMHARIRDEAKANGRSINAEIVYRLQETLKMEDYFPDKDGQEDTAEDFGGLGVSEDEAKEMVLAIFKTLDRYKKKRERPSKD
ncbi:Arc family DNA-binding protein [Devosia sp.]|uniref:Arc family DNA-binding protein n=1 Tax=Devosia sp. TaxID=1871048 RepID=UPI002AFE1DF5|nr:Arc family DNA-binding protein [Devosia sp.]